MAFFAIGSQVVSMSIIMTAIAIGEGCICKFLKIFPVPGLPLVALNTLHIPVFSQKGKVRTVVVKFIRR